MTAVDNEGVIAEWNEANTERQLKVGDAITEVNGATAHDAMIEAMGKTGSMAISATRSATRLCSSGHALLSKSPPHNVCDLCDARNCCARCDECDYDLCQACFDAGGAQLRPPIEDFQAFADRYVEAMMMITITITRTIRLIII